MIRPRRRSQSNRRGLTILEVIISIGIFLASAAIVTQHLGVGTRAAVEGRLRSQLALLAESKMAEIASGVQEMTGASGEEFDDETTDPSFTWGMEVDEGGQGDLLQVTVTVEHTNAQDEVDYNFELTRLMRDPQIWIDAALESEDSSSGGIGAL